MWHMRMHYTAGATAAAAAGCRLVQEPGSFVLALPGAFTCSVATGFCISERLALAPWDWLGHGTDAARKARLQRRPAGFSMDQLLVALVRGNYMLLCCFAVVSCYSRCCCACCYDGFGLDARIEFLCMAACDASK
jgi:hypothetical protein